MNNTTAPCKSANICLNFIVTCGFIGYLPGAPGTWASLFGCLILYFISFSSLAVNIIFLCIFILFSTIAINLFKYEGDDPAKIVIDELAGMFVTMAGHSPTPVNLFAGFILFRFFDILKPYPIRHAERLKGGYGIMADDILAGIFANLMVYLYLFLYGKL